MAKQDAEIKMMATITKQDDSFAETIKLQKELAALKAGIYSSNDSEPAVAHGYIILIWSDNILELT